MSDHSTTASNSETKSPDGEAAFNIGKTLQDAREALNITIESAARQLHLDARLLKALESEDYSTLPGTTYAYGYLRSYAKLLKLPEEKILQEFMRQAKLHENVLIPEHMTFSEKNKVPSFSFTQGVLIVFLLVTVTAAVVWVLLGSMNENVGVEVSIENITPVPETNISEAAAISSVENVHEETIASVTAREQEALPDSVDVKQVAAVEVKKPGKALQLVYKADSWTEVRDANNNTLIFRMVRSGERLELDGLAPYTILLGYAPGVSVSYKETIFDTKPFRRDDIAYFRVGKKISTIATEE